MTDPKHPPFGTVAWRDLTVEDAGTLRDFYAAVAGWRPNAVSMGDYEDFDMRDNAGNSVAGICHARGSNANLPPQWLIYILVEDVMAAAAACSALGGEVVDGPRDMGGGRFCVIRDPGGAHAALYQPQGDA